MIWVHRAYDFTRMSLRCMASLPRDPRLRAIPFALSFQDAREAYKRFHAENFLLTPIRQFEKTKESFCPFFIFSGHVKTIGHSAQVGYDRTGVRYNPSNRQAETYRYVDFRSVTLNQNWTRDYFPTEPHLQVYAGSKYNGFDLSVIKPGAAVSDVRRLDPNNMIDEGGKEAGDVLGGERLRRLYPFTLSPSDATHQALSWIRSQEEEALRESIRIQYPGASRVQLIEFTCIPSISAHPIFVPVVVFTTRSPYMKLKSRTFVGAWGSNPEMMPVSGTRQYDEVKVAGLVGILAPIALLLLGVAMPMSWTSLFWWGSIAPGLVSGTAARYSADSRAWLLQAMMTPEEDRLNQERLRGTRGILWDEDWVTAFPPKGEERRNRRDQSSQHEGRYQRQESRERKGSWERKEPDVSYYELLGVSNQASTSEIQAAFRASVLKNHPDLVTGESEKRAASERFQRLHVAYSTLRDANKRREYDMTL